MVRSKRAVSGIRDRNRLRARRSVGPLTQVVRPRYVPPLLRAVDSSVVDLISLVGIELVHVPDLAEGPPHFLDDLHGF